MSEKDMRSRLVRALKPLHAIAVENPVLPGTPDINYRDGWVEAKWLRAWPRRPETVVPLEHFTQQQRFWLRQRCRAGGAAWLILQCRNQWLVFRGSTAAKYLGHVPRAELESLAEIIFTNLKDKDLLEWIRKSSPPANDSASPDDALPKA